MIKLTDEGKTLLLLVIYYLLSFCGLVLGMVLAIPLFAGAFKIIYQDGSLPSATASIGLAILATAIAAVVLWFADKFKSVGEVGTRKKLSDLRRRSVITVGIFLLFAAFCFALFALLSPLLPDAIKAKDFLSIVVKWIGFLSLMAGSISLGLVLCMGIFEVWFWHVDK
jgi:cytochrome c biogenesis factor